MNPLHLFQSILSIQIDDCATASRAGFRKSRATPLHYISRDFRNKMFSHGAVTLGTVLLIGIHPYEEALLSANTSCEAFCYCRWTVSDA